MSRRDDEPAEFASPPCFLHELDPAWSSDGTPCAEAAGDCEFCLIASGARPAHVVAEDAEILAFVDSAPIREGHLQIVPKVHYACFDDLPADLAARILHLGQRRCRSSSMASGGSGSCSAATTSRTLTPTPFRCTTGRM